MAEIEASEIVNRKYELGLKNEKEEEVGKIYLEFYDSELDIQEDIKNNKSEVKVENKE